MSRFIRDDNRVPVTGGISATDENVTVPIAVDPSTNRQLVQSLNVGTLINVNYDYIAYTATNATTDTYVFKTGGSGGTTVATLTIVYTDGTKEQISTVTRT